jgi:hypothetical protein
VHILRKEVMKMKVLVIKPIKVCSAEEMQKLADIKPNEGGVVVLPSYCEYEFGEIDRLKVITDTSINDKAVHDAYLRGQAEAYPRGYADSFDKGYAKGVEDFINFEKFFYSGKILEVFDDARNEDGSWSIEGILSKVPLKKAIERIENYSNQGE